MRPELARLIAMDWVNETAGVDDHASSILELKPTRSERGEFCAMLRKCNDVAQAAMFSTLMELDPRPEYHDALQAALESPNQEVVDMAAKGLLAGKYPDGLQIALWNKKVQQALGDQLPHVLLSRAGDMTEEMIEKYLDLFCQRFGETTSDLRGFYTDSWLDCLARLKVSDARVAAILLRLWGNLHPSDIDGKYKVLTTMAACPCPSYEAIFKQAKKSKVEDLRELADEGLAELERVRSRTR